jgi:ABC-type glycerol-3-phosphate transport system substrate-binding protein
MIRRPASLLAVLLLGGALLVGCGGGSSTTTTTTTATTTSTSTPAATTPGSTPQTTTGAKPLAGASQAIEACKHQIQSTRNLSASVRSKLESVCVKAASGDTAAVKQAGREVGEEVINTSRLPAGASKNKALAACRK